MTDIRPSPEMLDAAAANRRDAPLEERDLDAAIATHRALFRFELWIAKLHVRDGESGIGVPFSPAFEAFLEGRLGAYPWSKAMLALRHNCRQTHAPKHTDRPEWRGSLCSELVALVVRQDYPLIVARLRLGLPEEGKTRRTLDNALLFLEARLEQQYRAQDRDQQADTSRTPAEWMAQAHKHEPLGGAHAVECTNPVCRRIAA